MQCQTFYELFHLPLYETGDGYKKYYYEMIKELKEYKKTGVSKLKK